nr:uncharacterized protein LOC109150426 [Ipomoea batatas]
MDRVGRCSKAIWIWGKEFARNFQRRMDYWGKKMDSTKSRRDQAGISYFNEDGDTNSSFFHNTVRRRKQANRISKLKNGDGTWIERGECDPQLPPANGKRKSVFKRIGKIESQRSVFDRLGSNPQAPKRKSIHDRLGVVQDVKNNASHPVEAEPSKTPRSMIPSRMRRETDIHISRGEVLKVQPRTIVHTRVQKGENEESVGSSDDVAPPQGEDASSFHITLCDEIPIEGEDAEEAPHELEEGVRAAIDELKEVDLGTPENPRPIFISTLLSNEDEKIYVELLKEYIDVFAWTYKEMPGLDPKVAVHRLAVKKTCRPVKQAQRRFRPELIPSIEGEVRIKK